MNKSIDLAVNNLQRFKFLTIRVWKKTRLARLVQFRDDFIFNEHVGSLSVFHVCLLFHLTEVYALVVHRYTDDIPLNQDKRGASRRRDYNKIALPDNSYSTIDNVNDWPITLSLPGCTNCRAFREEIFVASRAVHLCFA